MTNRPAVKFLLPLMAGIVMARIWDLPPGLLLSVTAILFLAPLFLMIALRKSKVMPATGFPQRALTALLALMVFSFGALLLSADLRLAGPRDLGRYLSGDTLTMEGTVSEMRGQTGSSARFLIECRAIRASRGHMAVDGRIFLTLSGEALKSGMADSLFPGRDVVLRGVVHPPGGPRNPGDVNWASYYQLAGITGRMSVRRPADIVPGEMSSTGFLNQFVLPVRRTLSEHLRSFVNDREARFLNGLILGERNEVPSDLKADFITVGVMHMLAISGQQVVIVALLIAALLTILRIPERPRFFIVAAALMYYVFLTGASPSVTRAGIMSIVLLGSRITQRRADIFNALGIAAILILLVSPRQLFDPGFLLSFTAVLAIVLLYPAIIGAFPGFTAKLARVKILDLAWKGVAVSLAAGIGTAPIVAYYFGRISVVGFLANIVIVPLSSLALVLGMLTVAASFVSSWVASVYAAGAEAAAYLTFGLVEFFAEVPFAMVNFRLSLLAVAVFYAFLFLLLSALSTGSWRRLIIGALILANGVLYAGLWDRSAREVFRVTFLDVGQGDAAFLEFPGGGTMLIDAGPKTLSFDTGEKIVLPFLEWMGVRKIDYLVVSHPHSDHLGGIPAIMRSVEIGHVIDCGEEAGTSVYRLYRKLIDSLRVPHSSPGAGDRFGEELPVRIYVLSPGSPSGVPGSNLNEHSIVLGIRYGATTVLFTGDAEDGAENEMAHRYGPFLSSGLLKAGHHGSITSSTPRFVDLIRPEHAVISVGEGNHFGHPSAEVLDRFTGLGTGVERTDLSGALIYESDGSGWRRIRWR